MGVVMINDAGYRRGVTEAGRKVGTRPRRNRQEGTKLPHQKYFMTNVYKSYSLRNKPTIANPDILLFFLLPTFLGIC